MTSFFYIVYNIRYIIRRIYHTRYGMVSLSDLTKNNNRDPLWLKLKRRLQRIIAAYRSITFGQWSICNFYPLLRFIYRKSAIETQNNKIIEKHSMILSKCDRKLLTWLHQSRISKWGNVKKCKFCAWLSHVHSQSHVMLKF